MAEPARIVALDHLRGFVVMLVVLHHSVLAYIRYGHFDTRHYLWSSAPIVDDQRWLGFDLLVLFNDSYFMPLLFLLSGLFVWPSLARDGAAAFCRRRLLRLGVPFAIAVLIVIPLAYYPSFRLTGETIGFAEFWTRTIFSGPWPSGPAWFVAVLLAFDLIAAMVCRGGGVMPCPLMGFAWLTTVSAVAYLPMLTLFGPVHWFAFGPFAVQASRVGLYGVYFIAGVMVGSRVQDLQLQRTWPRWSLLAMLLFGCLVAELAARLNGWPALSRLEWTVLPGLSLVVFCAAANFAMFAIFLRFADRSGVVWDSAVWDRLARNAFGIYMLHYPAVTWTQYALLDLRLSAIAKAALVFSVALPVSWGTSILLRRVPGVARII